MRTTKILLAIVPVMLTACPPPSETQSAAANSNEIMIGEYASLTGSEATFGTESHNAIMVAIDEINAAGGVNGKQLRIVTEDTQSRPDEAANAVTKLVSRGDLVAILGEVASSNSIVGGTIAQRNKIPMISPSSTNPAVTEKGEYVFRVCYIDPYQGQALADYVTRTLGMRRAAILTDVKSDYSTGLARYFEEHFVKNGGAIVVRQSYAKGDNDFRSQLTSIRGANPDVIFVPGYYNDIGPIAIQARDIGIQQPIVGGDGWESPKLVELGGDALEGTFYSTHYFPEDPKPLIQSFVAQYRKRHGRTPDGLAALGYDAARVLADAIRRAGSTDRAKIRDAIAATEDFPGVTGTISMGPDRNPVGKELVIVEVRAGKLVLKDRISGAG